MRCISEKSQSEMDDSLVSTSERLPQWLRILRDENEYEDESWTVMLLEREGRKAVWCMSKLLGVDKNGVPGQACELLERYLSIHLRETTVNDDFASWVNIKRALASRMLLLIASCIQLAAKMSSAGVQLNPNLVRAYLHGKGVVYPVSQIIASEFQVFSTLGFRVPLWTSVEAAQLLAVELGMPHPMLEGVALVVNMTEYRRDQLNHRVKSIANISPGSSINKAKVRTMHLVAGAVLASARFLGFQGQDIAARLGELTSAPACYIKCVCDVILTDVLIDDENDGESSNQNINDLYESS